MMSRGVEHVEYDLRDEDLQDEVPDVHNCIDVRHDVTVIDLSKM